MRISYRTDNVPACGAGAFLPQPARTGTSATAGIMRRYAIFGKNVPSPNPQLKSQMNGPPYSYTQQGSFADPPAGLSQAFARQSEFNSREPYWVSNYANGELQMGPNGAFLTMKIYSDNPLPVPATNYIRSAAPVMKQPPWATIVTTGWPRPFVTWPTWGNSRSM